MSIRTRFDVITNSSSVPGYQNAGVIALADKVSIQHCCNDAGMPIPYAGIIRQVPARTHPVGMHDQHAVLIPGKAKLLDPVHLEAHGTVMRSNPSAVLGLGQTRGNVAQPGEAECLTVSVNGGSRNRSTAGFL